MVVNSYSLTERAEITERHRLVFLPVPTASTELICIGIYLFLAIISLSRILRQSRTHLVAAEVHRKHQIQWLIVFFSICRCFSFITHAGPIRDLLNRGALCFFFSVVLFKVLFWIDIANPKRSTRSTRLWKIFILANGLVYIIVLIIPIIQNMLTPLNPTRSILEICSVILVAMGSFLSACGLIYSSYKLINRVRRVLTQRQLQYQTTANLQMAMRLTNTVMILCAIIFLIRGGMYIQRLGSKYPLPCELFLAEGSSIDTCVYVEYVLPETIPCILFLILLWELEPNRYKIQGQVGQDVDINIVITERTPLLWKPSNWAKAIPIRAINMNLARKASKSARRMDKFVLGKEHINKLDLGRSTSLSGSAVTLPFQFAWLSFQCYNIETPLEMDPSFAYIVVVHKVTTSLIGTKVGDEIGRTEAKMLTKIDSNFNYIKFQVMLAVEMDPTQLIRASLYGVKFKKMNATSMFAISGAFDEQQLIGQADVSLGLFTHSHELIIGGSTRQSLAKGEGNTDVFGSMVVYCEAEVKRVSGVLDSFSLRHSQRRTTRAFIGYADFESVLSLGSINLVKQYPQGNFLVEEELVESVFTWDIPYQFLQLRLSQLITQLAELRSQFDSDNELDEEDSSEEISLSKHRKLSNRIGRQSQYGGSEGHLSILDVERDSGSEVSSFPGSSSMGMLSEMIFHIQDDSMERKKRKAQRKHIKRMERYIREISQAIELYENGSYGDGVTFKPSTRKDDPKLCFVATNLHQQLMTVVNSIESYNDASSNLSFDQTSASFSNLRHLVNEVTSIKDSQYAQQMDENLSTYSSGYSEVDLLDDTTDGNNKSKTKGELSIEPERSPRHLSISSQACVQTCDLYGTTTVGVFAAHSLGFRHGGIRQLKQRLQRIHSSLEKETNKMDDAVDLLTKEALERSYDELKWHIERRMDAAFSQAMSALVTSFQQTLYAHIYASNHSGDCICSERYIEQMYNIGFLFSVESLVSTYGKEEGMLGDMDAAMRELRRVQLRLKTVDTPEHADFRVTLSTEGITSKDNEEIFVIELPVILSSPKFYRHRKMHRVAGQDARSGAVFLDLPGGSKRPVGLIKRMARDTIDVIPVLFSQGMNELQTVANTVGKDLLQKEINAENLVILENYVHQFLQKASVEDNNLVEHLKQQVIDLRSFVMGADRGKCMEILHLSSSISRAVGGGRVSCCKSAKDRTAMSVTLEEATLLAHANNLTSNERSMWITLLRTFGVRRENARKNIGEAQYCFNTLQNYMLPPEYQCPPGTGGGSKS